MENLNWGAFWDLTTDTRSLVNRGFFVLDLFYWLVGLGSGLFDFLEFMIERFDTFR